MIYDIDINKIIVSKKVSYGKKVFKYFIGYEDDEKFMPFCIMLPKIGGYRKIIMKLNICLFL